MSQLKRYSDYPKDEEESGANFLIGAIVAFVISGVLWFLIFTIAAHADPLYEGDDFLGLQSPYFDVTGVTKLILQNSALGTLHGAFGTSLAPIDYVLSSGKISFYRVHLADGTCLSVRNCGSYTPFSKASVTDINYKVRKGDGKLYRYFSNTTRAYCNFLSNYPSVTFAISPILEHRLSVDAWRRLSRFIQSRCPSALIVSNSVYGTKYGKLQESHSPYPSRYNYITSSDGFNFHLVDFNGWLRRSESSIARFRHFPSYNCRVSGGFIAPRLRKHCLKASDYKRIKEKYAFN